MDTNVLRTFIAVCEYAGFSAAAEKLGYTQSTVSSQIKQLETELDTVLLDRFYHRITLTADGEKVLQYARRMVDDHEQLLSALRRPGAIEGTLRLAMSSSVCDRYLKSDYLRFRELYPGIRLIVSECGTEQMFDRLRKNEADLVFTLDDHIYDSEYIICAEREEQVHFIAAADNPVLGIGRCTLQSLCDRDFVLTERDMSYRILLHRKLSARSLELHPVLEVGNPHQICEIVRASRLLSFLPDFIAEEYIASGALRTLDVADCSAKVWTQLLIHKNKWCSPALTAFIEFYKTVVENV